MKPVIFKECNHVYAKDQPQYGKLPCFHGQDAEGTIVVCWKLTIRDRLRVLLTGCVWQVGLTFNRPLMPQHFLTKRPFSRKSRAK